MQWTATDRASDRISNPGAWDVVQAVEEAVPGNPYCYTTRPETVDYYVFLSGRYTLSQLVRFLASDAQKAPTP